jgi:hypothetical protein
MNAAQSNIAIQFVAAVGMSWSEKLNTPQWEQGSTRLVGYEGHGAVRTCASTCMSANPAQTPERDRHALHAVMTHGHCSTMQYTEDTEDSYNEPAATAQIERLAQQATAHTHAHGHTTHF